MFKQVNNFPLYKELEQKKRIKYLVFYCPFIFSESKHLEKGGMGPPVVFVTQ